MPVTLKDIATKCGLAVSTVSNILNDNKDSYASERVKKLVKDTAEELGYRKHYLSVSLRTRKTLSIGLCIDHIVYETRRYFLDAFVEAFNDKGYEVAITTHEMDPGRALTSLRFFEQRFKDGIVFFTDFLRDIGPDRDSLVTELERSPVKILGIGSELRGVVPSLDIERAWAFRDCIGRLRKDGHRKIIVVYKTPADFREALPAFGKPDCVHMDGIYTADDFRARWPAVHAAHPDATAVFFRSDEIAIPALAWFADNGIAVPGELSVA
ncbi:MAG: LacI family DNA-binding transcriptional regulator, partial [Chitinivibrionales bacterium]|nr:LacI family DNA-binding transcriptional regulator [Chitinivibrionales bacterium]